MTKNSPVSSLGIIIWLLAAIFFLYEFFLRTFVGSVAHEIIPDLKLSIEQYALLGTAYYVSYGLMQIPVGILADKFGVRNIMAFATFICALAAFLFSHATNFYEAFFSRLLMGFGSAFAFICLLVIVVSWFPRKNFGFLAGFSQFIGTLGPLFAAGPLIAMMVASHSTWRVSIMYAGVFGLVLAILIYFMVRDNPYADSKISDHPKAPLWERLKALAKMPQAWYCAAYTGTVYISISLLGAIWGMEYLEAQGLSQTTAADIISFAWLGYAVGCPLLGGISDVAKRRKPTLIMSAALGLIAVVWLTYFPVFSHWLYGLLFIAVGVAASGQNVAFATVSEHVDFNIKATALSLSNGSISLFNSTMPLMVGYGIQLASHGDVSHLKPQDFILGFSVMPVLFLAALLIARFLIKETYAKPQV